LMMRWLARVRRAASRFFIVPFSARHQG